VALQARAAATRHRILASAVELFSEFGYGETGLADVLQRSGVSKGAFYYHFDSKEAVAVAIIEDYRRANTAAVRSRIDPAAPLLEQIIVASFASAELIESDPGARIGNELLQALSQISGIASATYRRWTEEFTGNLTAAVEALGVRDDRRAAEIAAATWAGLLGCHFLSCAINDDPYARLASLWRSMVRSVMPTESAAVYDELIETTARRFRTAAA